MVTSKRKIEHLDICINEKVESSGNGFGDIGFYFSSVASPNVTVSGGAINGVTDYGVLVVNKANFQRMVQTQPQLISKLTTLLSERLWFIYKQLANSLMTDPLGKMYDALNLQLEKNRIPINQGESYTFDFGPKELVTMVGLPVNQGNAVTRKLFENKKIKVVSGKVCATDIEEIRRQSEYFRKMEKIERSRRQGSIQNR